MRSSPPIRLFLEGHVDWSGDYHEYFEINNVPEEAEVKRSLIAGQSDAEGAEVETQLQRPRGQGNFLTLPSVCSSTTTSHLELES